MKIFGMIIGVSLVALVAACGGGDSDTPAESTARARAEATLDAAIENAEELGVTAETREYAKQWCDPLRSLFDELVEISPTLEAANEEEDFEAFEAIIGVLLEPMERFLNDLEDMDPPEPYKAYHAGFLAEGEFALEAIRLIEEGGIFAALALGDEPPSVEEPPELESAFAIECGEEFLEILESDEFGNIFGDDEVADEPTAVPAATGPGSSRREPAPLGSSVQTPNDLEVRVSEVELDGWPLVQAESSFNDPPLEGRRMALVTVSVTYSGTGDETVFVSSSEFSLTGSNSIVYRSFDDGVYCGSIPVQLNGELFSGGTLEGNVCFQYPEDETGLILIVEPTFSFDSSERRYLALE